MQYRGNTMPETQEGSSNQSLSGEEPQVSAIQGEDRYQAVPETAPTDIFDNFAEPAGETSDVVVDDKQETNEDNTADEEEPTTWQSAQSPEERINQPVPEDEPPVIPTQQAVPNNAATNSDVFEAAGETADVVQDATQSGSDKRAAYAEELSLDQDTTHTHTSPKKEA
jgi:hypothetical protein